MPDSTNTIVVSGENDLETLLGKEWLLSNRIGAYASSTACGCNTRKYHGLLIASASPPVERFLALSTVMEQIVIDEDPEQVHELATNEFEGAFSPCGCKHLVEFRNDAAVTFIYRIGDIELTREIILADSANAVAVRYTVKGGAITLRLNPFTALRDYHNIRSSDQLHQMTFEQDSGGVTVHDLKWPEHNLHLTTDKGKFQPNGQWWRSFIYRADIARGQDGNEDLYTPGCFEIKLSAGESCQLTACANEPKPLNFSAALASKRERLSKLADSVRPHADRATRALAVATDAFVVNRDFETRGKKPSATILAGFPWFTDWGRDAFIALPGLLLNTARFDQAKEVFQTFADHIDNGMIPNCFGHYGSAANYNSIDASLWFISAADRYVETTGDTTFWLDTLMPACDKILTAYHDGTRFDIHADADGLLMGGSRQTQLTWMDAKIGDEVVTARHGKPVEVNALWYNAQMVMANRCRNVDRSMAERYASAAQMIASAFVKTFWYEEGQYLYDCVTDSHADDAIRPNQILAVSLPHSPLSTDQQQAVVRIVTEQLLTPMGLRTLSPADKRYRRMYGGSWESRDRAYHQGTVWAWLIGPFIEAYLKVEQNKPAAVKQARQWLSAFDAHLDEGGLGFISEIFDGDAPHAPRGCFAQAWSIAEVLRAKQLVES